MVRVEYTRNLPDFLTPLVAKEGDNQKIEWSDPIVAGTALTRDGQMVHPNFTSAAPTPFEAAAGGKRRLSSVR